MSRRIAIVTSTRAEYGLFFWLIHELKARGADVQLIVSGTHLSEAHGYTAAQIERDGLSIAARVDIGLGGDSQKDVAESMGRCVSGMAAAFARLNPEIVVLLGDRYEILATASAAALMDIPIAHLHGGEITEGAIDESMRHAISKLSYWHFASTQDYARRIIQMGESPERVFTVGAIGIDNFARLDFFDRSHIEEKLGFVLEAPLLLMTYHPETHSKIAPLAQIQPLLNALQQMPEVTLIISGANADAGGNEINTKIAAFTKEHPRTLFHASYGSKMYLSLMRQADIVIGNSSSGVIEAPIIGKAAVNIGDRQKGRARAASVIDCPNDTQEILIAIKKALSESFRATLSPSHMFGVPGSVAPTIAEILMTLPLPKSAAKAFYDLPAALRTL